MYRTRTISTVSFPRDKVLDPEACRADRVCKIFMLFNFRKNISIGRIGLVMDTCINGIDIPPSRDLQCRER